MHPRIANETIDEPLPSERVAPAPHPSYEAILAGVREELSARVELGYLEPSAIEREANRRMADYERADAYMERYFGKGRWHVTQVVRTPAQV